MSAPVPLFAGLHLSFGGDAARQVLASWATRDAAAAAASAGAVLVGPDGRRADARVSRRSYTDAVSGVTVHGVHADWDGLEPDTTYAYEIEAAGERASGTVTTAPAARAPVSFTVFGDQGAPPEGAGDGEAGADDGLPIPGGGLGSPIVTGTTAAVEAFAPHCHVVVGDLAYANLARDRVRTWERFWANTSRSARHRPWLAAPGNHENELGNGPLGYDAYRTHVAAPLVPAPGVPAGGGLWSATTLGSVRIVLLHGDDLAVQDGGDSYVHGYSGGAQLAWLEEELALARADPRIDWIVVGVHQIALGTADEANGSDLGVRRALFGLCDAHDVDLVVGGHDHHYERSHPVRGHLDDATWTPLVAPGGPEAYGPGTVDATTGTVHVVVGTGGTSSPTHERLLEPPAARVITRVGGFDPLFGRRPPVYRLEPAPWSAFRDARHPYGFLSGVVDPDAGDGLTSLTLRFHAVLDEEGTARVVDTVTLFRPRSGGRAAPDLSLSAGAAQRARAGRTPR